MSSSSKSTEIQLSKIYSTVLDIDKKPSSAILPKNVTADDIRKYIETQIKDAQPRYLRTDGRPSFRLQDYKIPFNCFVVGSNTVGYIAGSGPIFMGDHALAGGINENSTQEEGTEVEVEIQEDEDILIDLEDSNIPKTGDGLLEGVISETESESELEEIVEEESEERSMFISNKKTSQRQTIPNQNVATQLGGRDYGEMIVNHIFINGRKTIDELIKEITAIDKILLTILVNKLIDEGYLQRWKDTEKDKETDEDIMLDTLELVPIRRKTMDSNNNNNNNNNEHPPTRDHPPVKETGSDKVDKDLKNCEVIEEDPKKKKKQRRKTCIES